MYNISTYWELFFPCFIAASKMCLYSGIFEAAKSKLGFVVASVGLNWSIAANEFMLKMSYFFDRFF